VNATAPEASILLIDDDRELGEMLSEYLAPDHLALTSAPTGEDGLAQLRERNYDLLILDIMLPGMSGLDVLRALRPQSDIPVIMLTARGDDVDRIIGLEIGADDYLAKPFNPRELSARIKAILRRSQSPADDRRRFAAGSLYLEPRTRRVRVGEQTLRLTGTEYEILYCLLETPGEVVSKDALSERALGRRLLPFDRSIDTHISNLRRKLVAAGASPDMITNQRGVGYLLLPGD
jgi:two-component system response regulator CpxR